MPAFALLAAASVASLNLCTDEYALLLARPSEIVSVTYLSQDPMESSLWREARHFHPNRGSLEDVVALRPNLLLTMGGGGRATGAIAARMHIRLIDLPAAQTLKQVASNLRLIAAAVGRPGSAAAWIDRMARLWTTAPPQRDAIWLGGSGQSLSPRGMGARWLALAGLRQRSLPDNRATFETLLTQPPKVLIQSNYRSGQMSGGSVWMANPIVRNARSRHITTDGRPWTCLGPLMIPEIERLRKAAR